MGIWSPTEHIFIFHYNCWFQHLFFESLTEINVHINCPHCLVCHLMYFTTWRDHHSSSIFTFFILISEVLPPPPPGSLNRPSVGGQRVSSDRHPRTVAVLWSPVIPAVSRVWCHCLGSLSRCWQMARWMHSGNRDAFSEWNHNTGPGPLLMECQMPAVRGKVRERWKTAIYHGRWGSRRASGDLLT